ncbi:hypothetical protein ASC77_08155 [Nocardioides sp. Root1257]|uniref:SigE family RNA polymerase sigma factor n=1 Tax=unclassified Nocardioides TaxID=2615069 RepID=UPI0006F4C0FF|nr:MULTISPECIES: SigE family RNA polymerase sigma factor [unclassified Nocardioides]KQW48700.1 hypothetical protein ASC77_08155 [Nocardioides sp. Root1257]KRC47875.1 hypothetical protein ASE24_08160 [Nocardioides sp. Root224]
MEDFEAWVHARGGALARTAYLLTGDVHLAEDLVQDTLARVAQHWRKVGEEPDAYARRVLHNLAIDRWRRRSVRPREVGGAHPEIGATGPDVERRLLLRDALLRLTPKQRAVLSLRFYEDLTEVQTAAVLGCSPNTVKSQTRTALERLRVLAPDLLAELTEEARS